MEYWIQPLNLQIHYTASNTAITGLGQTFSNVTVNATWLVTGASGVIQCNGALVTINGRLDQFLLLDPEYYLFTGRTTTAVNVQLQLEA